MIQCQTISRQPDHAELWLFNLPPKKHTVSAVAKLFEPFGEINLIHLLWPGKTIPDTFGRAVTEHMKKTK